MSKIHDCAKKFDILEHSVVFFAMTVWSAVITRNCSAVLKSEISR